MARDIQRIALQPGYKLHSYTIERILGQGGFGITYLARDPHLDRQVAIKEYIPMGIAMRDKDLSVQPVSESLTAQYYRGLQRFIKEARTIAQFDHPNLLRVHAVLDANHTAYMVMRCEEGETLLTRIIRCKRLEEVELVESYNPHP